LITTGSTQGIETTMTTPVELVGAVLTLCVAVIAGTAAHELAHGLALRFGGVPYTIRWRPRHGRGRLSPSSALAAVTPQAGATATATTHRLAALAPLALATPFVLVLVGLVPDPFQHAPLPVQAALVGWLGCAIPSPQDFAVVWHAERALENAHADEGASEPVESP
jgi:hypothetical protein